MSKEATAKGTFLTVGIALMTTGTAIIQANPLAGGGFIVLGGLLIFLREYLKEV